MKKYIFVFFIMCFSYSVSRAQWAQLPRFAGTPRSSAASFALGDTGYIVAGGGNGGYLSDTWQYIAYTGIWAQIATYPGSDQNGIIGFSIDENGYAGTGSGPG